MSPELISTGVALLAMASLAVAHQRQQLLSARSMRLARRRAKIVTMRLLGDRRARDQFKGPYAGGTLKTLRGQPACQGARALANQRLLMDELPRLPLAECECTQCYCQFEYFDDRRDGVERRISEGDRRDGVRVEYPRRSGKDRRRGSWNYAPAEFFAKYQSEREAWLARLQEAKRQSRLQRQSIQKTPAPETTAATSAVQVATPAPRHELPSVPELPMPPASDLLHRP